MSFSCRSSAAPLVPMVLSAGHCTRLTGEAKAVEVRLSSRERAVPVPTRSDNNLENLIKKLLVALGEDPEREGLKKTPSRVAKSLEFLTQGCDKNLPDLLNDAVFEEAVDEMVVVRDIE